MCVGNKVHLFVEKQRIWSPRERLAPDVDVLVLRWEMYLAVIFRFLVVHMSFMFHLFVVYPSTANGDCNENMKLRRIYRRDKAYWRGYRRNSWQSK